MIPSTVVIGENAVIASVITAVRHVGSSAACSASMSMLAATTSGMSWAIVCVRRQGRSSDLGKERSA